MVRQAHHEWGKRLSLMKFNIVKIFTINLFVEVTHEMSAFVDSVIKGVMMSRTRPCLRYVCPDEHQLLSNETYDVHSRIAL
jgi:hypothetical protein